MKVIGEKHMNKYKLILKLITIIHCLIVSYLILDFQFNKFQTYNVTLGNWQQFQPLLYTSVICWIIWSIDLLLTVEILTE